MRTLFLAAAALAASCVADAAGPKADKKAKAKQDNVLVAELQQAYRVLDLAEPIYHGHRGKALKEINHAIGHLQKEMNKHGMKQHHLKSPIKEPKSVSNAMVAESAREVGVVLKQLGGLPTSNHRKKAAEHLTKAIAELEKALASVKADKVKGPK